MPRTFTYMHIDYDLTSYAWATHAPAMVYCCEIFAPAYTFKTLDRLDLHLPSEM